GCLWLRSAEGQSGSQSTLLLGDQFPTVLLLVRDRFFLGAPDRLDFSDLVLRFFAGHISFRPSIRVWWVTRTYGQGRHSHGVLGWDYPTVTDVVGRLSPAREADSTGQQG